MQVCLKQLTAEQLLNKKIQIIKSTAEPFVQIYKEEKKKKKECFPAVKAPTIQWQQGEKAMCK